jgi:hypothetical protein
MLEELSSTPDIVKADPRWQEAMRKRGYTNLRQLHIDGWAPGTVGLTTAEGPRLIRALTFDKTNATSNVYSRPVEGLDIVVDMNQRKVIEFNDRGAVICAADVSALVTRGVVKSFESSAEYTPVTIGGETVDIGGSLNVLTSSRTAIQGTSSMAPNSCLVQVLPWVSQGAVPANAFAEAAPA